MDESLLDVFPEATVHELRTHLQFVEQRQGIARIFAFNVFGDSQLFDISLHTSGERYVFEFEPNTLTEKGDLIELTLQLFDDVKQEKTHEAMISAAVKTMSILTSFDRVEASKFNAEGGTLTLENAPQYISGLAMPTSEVLIRVEDSQKDFDHSLCVTRMASATHISDFCKTEVGAFLSFPIVQDGQFWGVIQCHHSQPRTLGCERRTCIALFAELLAYEFALRDGNTPRISSTEADHLVRNILALIHQLVVSRSIAPYAQILGGRIQELAQGDKDLGKNPLWDTDAPPEQPKRIQGNALILEDNMFIAMSAVEALQGVCTGKVFVTSSTDEAMVVIESDDLQVAVLDVRIGTQTSAQVAEALRAKGIPFLLATGLGANGPGLEHFPKAQVLQKPYTADMLKAEVIALTRAS